MKWSDLQLSTGGWSNFSGYEVRVVAEGYDYCGGSKRVLSVYQAYGTGFYKGLNNYLHERSGAKRSPSFGRVKEYLKTDEAKQFLWAMMWERYEGCLKPGEEASSEGFEKSYGFTKIKEEDAK